MICSIMQPTYLPWAGYFALINASDLFLFYDDAQYSKNSWHNRNKVLLNKQPQWLSISISHKNRQNINQTVLSCYPRDIKKQIKTINTFYGKAPFFCDVLEVFEYLLELAPSNLAELNINTTTYIAQKLGLKTKLSQTSLLSCSGERSEKLLQILTKVNCSHYLSPLGAKDYIQEDGVLEHALPVTYCNFTMTDYSQHNNDNFISHLSIIDLIASCGWKKSSQYIEELTCQIKNIN